MERGTKGRREKREGDRGRRREEGEKDTERERERERGSQSLHCTLGIGKLMLRLLALAFESGPAPWMERERGGRSRGGLSIRAIGAHNHVLIWL